MIVESISMANVIWIGLTEINFRISSTGIANHCWILIFYQSTNIDCTDRIDKLQEFNPWATDEKQDNFFYFNKRSKVGRRDENVRQRFNFCMHQSLFIFDWYRFMRWIQWIKSSDRNTMIPMRNFPRFLLTFVVEINVESIVTCVQPFDF